MVINSPEQAEPLNSTAPPLSIRHLLILTATIALGFGFAEAFAKMLQPYIGAEVSQRPFFARVLAGFSSLANGMALAGAIWLVDWRRTIGSFPLQPGHWILIGNAISFLIGSAVVLIFFMFSDVDSGMGSNWTIFFLQSIEPVIISIIAIMAFSGTTGIWKSVFGFAVMVNFFALVTAASPPIVSMRTFGFLSMTQNIMFTLLVMFCLVAVVVDRVKKRRRDWIHRFGLLVVFWIAGTYLATSIFWSYYFLWKAA
jgi:hypothetical protein